MTLRTRGPYNRIVIARRLVGWSAAAGALLALLLGGPAAADPSIYNVGNSTVLNISIEGGAVAIKTWDRQAVQTESTVPLQVVPFGDAAVQHALHGQIPVPAATLQTRMGQQTLPDETFVLSSFGNGPHDGLLIKGAGGMTTIMVPQSTALIVTRMQRGLVSVDGYRGGSLYVRLHDGAVHLQNDGGDGFVQVMRGAVYVNDSSFARLRARTVAGNVFFERCQSRQVEVSSILGSIGYDNGSFEPGLARFESQYGRVALGLNGNVQISAHSGNGRILTDFDRHANVDMRSNDASVALGNNGAMVNVTSGAGVLLYEGSIEGRRDQRPAFQQYRETFTHVQGRARGINQSQRAVEVVPRINPPAPQHHPPAFPRNHRPGKP